MNRAASLGVCLLLGGAVAGWAATVDRVVVSASAEEQTCRPGPAASTFSSSDRQAFVWFVARDIAGGSKLLVEWVDPRGEVAQTAAYEDLPASRQICFLTQLPIAGFEPASLPGGWRVRVTDGSRVLREQPFQIAGGAADGSLFVSAVNRKPGADGSAEYVLDGAGFDANSIVHIAQYDKRGGWRYLAALLPESAMGSQMTVKYKDLAPGEYVFLVRGSTGVTSAPARLLISTLGYKLPFAAGSPWNVTQGPYGAFSHWNNALHAYDIAPSGSGRCIVAMRAGIAYTRDLGMGQTPHLRSFGNYITVDHGDGEWSHYAHLRSGTFVVKNGQPVEQGQALAQVGNSGYTLGAGGGVHVHVHVTKAAPVYSPSVPFQFEEFPEIKPWKLRGIINAAHASPLADCARPAPALLSSGAVSRSVAGPAKGTGAGGGPVTKPRGEVRQAAVPVGEWWSELKTVPKNTAALEIAVDWENAGGAENGVDFELVLTSPAGEHRSAAAAANSRRLKIEKPEAGLWRVSVRAIRGRGSAIPFQVETWMEQPPPGRRGR